MIKIEKTEVMGFEQAICGMRNPMNSWNCSDSYYNKEEYDSLDGRKYDSSSDFGYCLGYNDYELMMKLVKGGPVHAKFRRMITVYVDITAPLYWWKEFDTYKVGTVANSCSTMHKITEKEFTIDDFSHDHLTIQSEKILFQIIDYLNIHRVAFLTTNTDVNVNSTALSDAACVRMKKDIWWQMIQLLPSSYNQKRTIMLNYEVLAGIYPMRKNHKLDEWRELCRWIERLPYSKLITFGWVSDEILTKSPNESRVWVSPRLPQRIL